MRTAADLHEIGKRLNNCIAQRGFASHYLIDLVSGEQCHLTTDDPTLTLIALRRHGRGLWSVEQIDGADFRSTRDRLEVGLRSEIDEAGRDPGPAWSTASRYDSAQSPPTIGLKD